MQHESQDHGKMLEIAGTAAQIILENGAETYRVEDTILRLCRSFGFPGSDVLALSTGVIISVSVPGDSAAIIRRVRKRSMNLSRVNAVNALSRRIAEGNVSMDDALSQLREIAESRSLASVWLALSAGLSAGCFAVMFGGGWLQFLIASLCGCVVQGTARWFQRADISLVLSSLVGGVLCSLITMGAYHLFPMTLSGVETTLAGAIMPLISGLMMTNAVRDSLRGDLLSGLARGAEALLVAVMVALGISLVLRFYLVQDVEALLQDPSPYLATAFAGLATLFFCPLLHLPKSSILPASVLGAAAYAFYLGLQHTGLDPSLALFLASAVIALLCELFARRMRIISTVFLCAALIPLVPGLGLYRTMRELLLSQHQDALALGIQTLFSIGAIALGAAFGSLRIRRRVLQKKDKLR